MTKTVYQTNAEGYYVGQSVADECQIEPGIFHIPAGCVEDEPPPLGEHQCAKWTGEDWQVVPFWVGHTYWSVDRIKHVITEIGVEPPPDSLPADPGPTAEEIKAKRIAELKASLSRLDQEKIRPLTDALLTGDTTRLVALEDQQQALRDELSTLLT